MIAFVAAALAVAAFLLFGVATDRHHEARFGRRLTGRHARRCRSIAWCMLAAGFVATVIFWGWIFGPIAWVGLAMAGAATSFLLLNLSPVPDRRRSEP